MGPYLYITGFLGPTLYFRLRLLFIQEGFFMSLPLQHLFMHLHRLEDISGCMKGTPKYTWSGWLIQAVFGCSRPTARSIQTFQVRSLLQSQIESIQLPLHCNLSKHWPVFMDLCLWLFKDFFWWVFFGPQCKVSQCLSFFTETLERC